MFNYTGLFFMKIVDLNGKPAIIQLSNVDSIVSDLVTEFAIVVFNSGERLETGITVESFWNTMKEMK